jgi:HSP20 family protein
MAPVGSAPMKLPSLWSGSQDLMSDPFRSIRREMEDMFRKFDQGLPSLRVGAGMPAINVAETKDALEVTIEVPGVEEKDINVTLDGNQLVISGEKKRGNQEGRKGLARGGAQLRLVLPFDVPTLQTGGRRY